MTQCQLSVILHVYYVMPTTGSGEGEWCAYAANTRQVIAKTSQRGPTHFCAKVGEIYVAPAGQRRPRFGDG